MSNRMGLHETGKARPTNPPAIHPPQAVETVAPALADVALIDARQCAAAAGLSLTTWYELVKAGKAPQPAFRGVRCTRWRLAEVRAFLVEFARTGLVEGR